MTTEKLDSSEVTKEVGSANVIIRRKKSKIKSVTVIITILASAKPACTCKISRSNSTFNFIQHTNNSNQYNSQTEVMTVI